MENEVNATPATVEAPAKETAKRGKKPVKAQIHSAEDMVSYVRKASAAGTPVEDIVARVREAMSAKFTEQKDKIADSLWPTVSKATAAKQEWLKAKVLNPIRNARKPKF